jgi:hypothetical protein
MRLEIKLGRKGKFCMIVTFEHVRGMTLVRVRGWGWFGSLRSEARTDRRIGHGRRLLVEKTT